jgi:hypothetical protein
LTAESRQEGHDGLEPLTRNNCFSNELAER